MPSPAHAGGPCAPGGRPWGSVSVHRLEGRGGGGGGTGGGRPGAVEGQGAQRRLDTAAGPPSQPAGITPDKPMAPFTYCRLLPLVLAKTTLPPHRRLAWPLPSMPSPKDRLPQRNRGKAPGCNQFRTAEYFCPGGGTCLRWPSGRRLRLQTPKGCLKTPDTPWVFALTAGQCPPWL